MNTTSLLLRTADLRPSPDPRQALRCEIEGCSRATREGKPFCVEHIGTSDYVRGLLEQIAAHERELERVERLGARAVRLDGLMVQEIVLQLRTYGDRTVERLARDLAIDHRIIRSYADRMVRAGMVRQGQTIRGHTCLKLMSVTPVSKSRGKQRQRAAG